MFYFTYIVIQKQYFMDNFKVAQSEIKDAHEAVKSIKEQLSGIDACLVLYFVSTSYSPDTICKEMADAFSGAHTVGCTTAGEFITGKMGYNSIVAMAWSKNSLKELKIEFLQNIKTDTQAVAKAFNSFEASIGHKMKNLNPERYLGMVIFDGMSRREEIINDQIGNLTNVPFIGGTAGDDLKFVCTYIFLDGKAYSEGAILLLMEPTNGYSILKTQSCELTGKRLTPTKVNENERKVIEFNNKPAAVAYSEALGVSIDDLPKYYAAYPLGLVFDEQNIFIRVAQQIEENLSLRFACSLKKGLELDVVRATDVVADTRADLKKHNINDMKAIVDFHCAYRFIELDAKNQMKEYSELFGNVPTIGFSTYGESYIGHMNQTSTMLLLK